MQKSSRVLTLISSPPHLAWGKVASRWMLSPHQESLSRLICSQRPAHISPSYIRPPHPQYNVIRTTAVDAHGAECYQDCREAVNVHNLQSVTVTTACSSSRRILAETISCSQDRTTVCVRPERARIRTPGCKLNQLKTQYIQAYITQNAPGADRLVVGEGLQL